MLNQGRDSCTYSPGNFVPGGALESTAVIPARALGRGAEMEGQVWEESHDLKTV